MSGSDFKKKIENFFADFLQARCEELLHKQDASGIILCERIAVHRQSKRADSKSGISPNSRTFCSVKVGKCETLADCTEAFPLQARENLLTLLMANIC
jgi:hypothetical protein